jgi:hypothetical protein
MRKNALATTWILRSLLLVVAATWAATNSYAQDGVLKDDAYTQSSTPSQNFGANANLRVASGINSYLRFDLSTLPAGTAGSDVAKATLRLYVNTLTTAGLFDVHRVIGAWNEGTITGNSAPSLGGAEVTGIGVPAGSVDSFVTVDITSLVQDWLDGVIANNGIALLPNAAGISVRFDSKENGTTSHEPRLEITLKGLAEVAHDGTLSGDGTSGNPLSVANQGVGNAQLANGAVSGAKIAAAQVVKSLNLLKDDVNLAAGSNVTITPSGNTLTIAAASGLVGVSHNTTLIGDGTGGSPLSVAAPLSLTGSDGNAILSVANSGSGAAITATGDINTSTQYRIGGSRVLSIAGAANVFVGALAGSSNGSGILNSFFGSGAGFSNTTASRNSFFGARAGSSNVTGFGNSFFGSDAGRSNTTSFRNSFFGDQSGRDNVSGSDNSFFGSGTGPVNTTGSSNSFFGSGAGISNTTGSGNTFFGSAAGASNTTGQQNSFFGASVGINNATGSANAFFGVNTGASNTTGIFNSFLGKDAGLFNTTGSDNTIVGALAGLNNITGSFNSFFGMHAGENNTTGDLNSFFGVRAGFSITTGSNNTFIGNNADAASDNLVNATAIGADAVVEQSNSVVLGNNANVGIGTSAPGSKLTVAGIIESTSGGLKFPDGTTQTTAATGGGGTITEITAGIGLTGGGTTGNVTIAVATSGVGTAQIADSAVTVTKLGFDPATQGELDAHKSSGDHDSRYPLIAHTHNVSEVNNAATLGANVFVGNQTVDGSVGIGAPNPAERLTVASSINPTIEVVPLAGGQTSGLRVYNASTRPNQGFFLLLDAAGELRTGNNVSWPYTFYTNGSERMRISQTGDVGIGTADPAQRLTVTGPTNPTIEVVPSAGGQTSGLRVYNANTRSFQGFFVLDDAVGELRTGNNVSWPYTFRTNGSEQMRITQTGNVGIGTTSPQAKLHVIGDFVATGTKSAIVALPDKRVVSLYAVESPENWFEDFGTAKLTGGVAEVALDSTFSQTVNTDMTYHVFLTPNGNSQGLYVAQKTSSGFEVREQGEGKSNVAFDYRIVARRRGYEELRLREVPSDSPAAAATNRRIPSRKSAPQTGISDVSTWKQEKCVFTGDLAERRIDYKHGARSTQFRCARTASSSRSPLIREPACPSSKGRSNPLAPPSFIHS